MRKNITITILGSSGGRAKGVLSLLNKSIDDINSPIYKILINSKILLIDINQKEMLYYEREFKNLSGQLSLYEFDLQDTDRFKQHLVDSKTDIVIDVSWADTVEMLSYGEYLSYYMKDFTIGENTFSEGLLEDRII